MRAIGRKQSAILDMHIKGVLDRDDAQNAVVISSAADLRRFRYSVKIADDDGTAIDEAERAFVVIGDNLGGFADTGDNDGGSILDFDAFVELVAARIRLETQVRAGWRDGVEHVSQVRSWTHNERAAILFTLAKHVDGLLHRLDVRPELADRAVELHVIRRYVG